MAAAFGFPDSLDLSGNMSGEAVYTAGDRAPTIPSADSFSRGQWMNAPDTTEPSQLAWNARVEPGFSLFDPSAPLAGMRSDLYNSAEMDLARMMAPGFGAGREVANRHDAPMNGRYLLHLTCRLRLEQDPWALQCALFAKPALGGEHVHMGNPLTEVESLQTLNFRLASEALDAVGFPETFDKASTRAAEHLHDVACEYAFVGFLAELTRSGDETIAELATTIWGHTQLTSSFVCRLERSTDKAPEPLSACGFVFGLVRASEVNQYQFNFGNLNGVPRIASLPRASSGSGGMLVPHVRALASRPGEAMPRFEDISDLFVTKTSEDEPLPLYWVSACQAKTGFDPSQIKQAKMSNFSGPSSLHPKYGEYNYVHVQLGARPEALR